MVLHGEGGEGPWWHCVNSHLLQEAPLRKVEQCPDLVCCLYTRPGVQKLLSPDSYKFPKALGDFDDFTL